MHRKTKRRLVAAAALLLVSATEPPGEADPERLYSEGVAARHAGDNERAVTVLRRVASAQPDNADVHLQLGLALMAAGRLDEAEAELRRTLALAPDYADAQQALFRLDERRSAPAAAGASAEAERWRLDLDGSYSALERSAQPDWREGSVQLRYQASPATAVGGGVELSRRFGETDVYAEARIEQRLSPGTSFYVSAGGTPNADFRPKWQIGAGISARVRSGPSATVLTLDARQARYRAGDIQTVSPGIEQYVAGGRAWLTGRWINVFDENGRRHGGWLARGDVMASPRLRLFAGAADAPDVSEGVVTDTFSLFGGASVDVSRRTSLRFSIAHEDRARGADRLQASVGVGLRF